MRVLARQRQPVAQRRIAERERRQRLDGVDARERRDAETHVQRAPGGAARVVELAARQIEQVARIERLHEQRLLERPRAQRFEGAAQARGERRQVERPVGANPGDAPFLAALALQRQHLMGVEVEIERGAGAARGVDVRPDVRPERAREFVRQPVERGGRQVMQVHEDAAAAPRGTGRGGFDHALEGDQSRGERGALGAAAQHERRAPEMACQKLRQAERCEQRGKPRAGGAGRAIRGVGGIGGAGGLRRAGPGGGRAAVQAAAPARRRRHRARPARPAASSAKLLGSGIGVMIGVLAALSIA